MEPHEDPELLVSVLEWCGDEREAGRSVTDGDVALRFGITLVQAATIRELFSELARVDPLGVRSGIEKPN